MATPRPTPYNQHNHIPSSSDAPRPVDQWQNGAQPDRNSAIQDCSCALCSATRHNALPVQYTMEHQDSWPLRGDSAPPFENQNLDAHNPTGIAATWDDQRQAQQVPNQDSVGYAPLREEVPIPQDQTSAILHQTQVFDMSVTEGLRRLARRYVDNPASLVNVVRLEPSTSGRFQIVIILEVADILYLNILVTIKVSK